MPVAIPRALSACEMASNEAGWLVRAFRDVAAGGTGASRGLEIGGDTVAWA